LRSSNAQNACFFLLLRKYKKCGGDVLGIYLGKRRFSMSMETTFLNAPYGGYFHSDIPKGGEELTQVGPGTACGEYLRRFWQPVALSDELKDLPKRIQILGEELVVFRDLSGKVGVLQLFCSHRGASLEFGLVSKRGIRCCYHGWLYDVDGKILETPGEPPESTLKDRLFHGAYPVHEYKGMVFAYMGPPDKKPPFPMYDFFDIPELPKIVIHKYHLPCNWLQVKENAMDPAHLVFLHTIVSGAQFNDDFGKLAEWDFFESPLGMIYTDTRRVGDYIWVRIADYIAPNIHQFPVTGSRSPLAERIFSRAHHTNWAVPVDDRNMIKIRVKHLRQDEEIPTSGNFGEEEERPYEERQRKPGDYEARCSIYDGLARHTREHLASTDRGIIMLRSIPRQGIKAVQSGQDPKGIDRESRKTVATYSSQRLFRVPRASSTEEDNKLLREVARRVAEETLRNPPSLSSSEEREKFKASLERSMCG
jgi:phenylpropionate dioxygenase-like ring-hydroxylating dioxygenase large terminal subunit